MPLYLTKFSYTPETWAKLIIKSEDRRRATERHIGAVGGTLHGFWYAFGAHDGYIVWDAPDNVSMAAVVLAIVSSGAPSSLETTVLLTTEEMIAALAKANDVKYQPHLPKAPAPAPVLARNRALRAYRCFTFVPL